MMDLNRLLDHFMGWRRYRDDVPFKVYLCLGRGYLVPRRVYREGLEGYFILSSDRGVVHLFNPNLKLYKKEEGFKCIENNDSREEKNGILYIKKAPEVEALFLDNQLYLLNDNFYYSNGWYQQLTKV